MKRNNIRRGSLLLAFALLLALLPAAALAAPARAIPVPEAGADLSGQVFLLHTNDTHARADNGMGFAGVAALKQAYEAAGATVLLLDAGDTLHGMPVFNLSQGENAVRVLNAAGYDAMVPGNHDFNYGMDRLRALAGRMDFPLLAANVLQDGKPAYTAHVVLERGGMRIGIFGLTTPDTSTQSNPDMIREVEFEDPAKAARVQVKALRQEGVDYIIALCHLGLEGQYASGQLARSVPGIDVIIDGHSHSLLPNGRKAGKTLIASTGEYLEHVGVVQLKQQGAAVAGLLDVEAFSQKDAGVEKLVAGLQRDTQRRLRATVGSTRVRLDGEKQQVRTEETNLGNLVADALRDAAKADIAMCNAGNIRVSIPAGKITKMQVLEVLPFANYLVKKQLTGAQVLQLLEVGVGLYPEADGRFPQVSGIRFIFDAGKPAGRRVTQAWVGEEPLRPEQKYTFATNDFIAAGGDGYTLLAAAPTLAEYGSMEDIVMAYLGRHKGYAGVAEGRIVIQNGK